MLSCLSKNQNRNIHNGMARIAEPLVEPNITPISATCNSKYNHTRRWKRRKTSDPDACETVTRVLGHTTDNELNSNTSHTMSPQEKSIAVDDNNAKEGECNTNNEAMSIVTEI